jgi:hypothetical protein
MERYRDDYSTHGHFRAELFIISFAVLVIGLFVYPKAKGVILDIKMSSAVDSVNSYKESIENYYVSRLLYDDSFKLDGVYKIDEGSLVDDYDTYNIMVTGNVPSSGYLSYQNNVLKDGCVVVGNYSVVVSDGNVLSAQLGSCDSYVALGI